MHPQDHHIALIAALVQLEQVAVPDSERTSPTIYDLRKALPSMNDREFETTFKNLRRRNKVRDVNSVRVPQCPRKVKVYGLWVGDLPKTIEQHQESLALWASMPASIEPIAEIA
jgi:hypothetical protein